MSFHGDASLCARLVRGALYAECVRLMPTTDLTPAHTWHCHRRAFLACSVDNAISAVLQEEDDNDESNS